IIMEKANEDILDGIPLGCWNIQFIALMGMVFITGPVQYYNSVFTNKIVNYTCSTNEDDLYGVDSCISNTSQSCKQYEFDQSENALHRLEACISNNTQSCFNYEFDPEEDRTTFTTEFSLVCQNAWVSDWFQLILTIGCIVGTACTGVGDRYGRRNVIRVSSLIHVFSILVIGLSPDPFLILAGRFLIGFTYPLINSTAYTLLTETTPPKQRALLCFMVSATFYVTVMMIGVIAYFISEWRMLYLVLSSLPLMLPLNAFLLDESPRWLQQQGRTEEALAILEKAASLNGGTVKCSIIKKDVEESSTSIKNNNFKSMIIFFKSFAIDFFGTKAMIKISLTMPVIWFMVATAYFGVPLTGHNITDNLYLYMIVIGAAELPISMLGPVLVKKLGNINSTTGLFAILVVCMLGILNLRNHELWWIKWVLITLSMNSIGLLNCLCSIMTCELFPTSLRTTALAFCKICYYIGFFTASYIESVSVTSLWWLYYAVCCISCVIGSLLIRFVPETHGSKLCNTIEEVIQRDKSNSDSEDQP
ncbi:unnamed protein product, partial [Meganyctiphanes norvegica]